jgi:hypothetical protein
LIAIIVGTTAKNVNLPRGYRKGAHVVKMNEPKLNAAVNRGNE